MFGSLHNIAGASSLLIATASLLTTDGVAAATPSSLTSDTVCNDYFCLRVIHDPGPPLVNYTMKATSGGKQIGWMAMGTGSRMASSNMMIGWVSTAGQPVMSQRTAGGHSPPTTTITTQAARAIGALTFSNSTGTVWSWTQPLSSTPFTASASTNYIWAVNPSNNPGDAPSSPIRQHSDHGVFTLDLTKAYTAPSDGGSSVIIDPSSTSGGGQTGASSSGSSGYTDTLVVVHLVFMTLAWMVISPIAVLIGRWGRTSLKAWYPAHQYLQIATIVFAIIGFGIIVHYINQQGGKNFYNTHSKVGLAVVILAVLQGALGLVGHKTKRFNPVRIFHIFVGIATTVLAIYNAGTGYEIWSGQNGKRDKHIVWGVGFGLFGGLYLLGLVLFPKQLKTWQMEAQEKEGLPYQQHQMNHYQQHPQQFGAQDQQHPQYEAYKVAEKTIDGPDATAQQRQA